MEGSSPSRLTKFCFAKFGPVAALRNATSRSILAAEGPSNNMWHVYILKCSDNSLYTGVTNDLPGRVKRHNQRRGGAYTRSRTPVKLIHSEECATKSQALKRELEIKDLSREKKLLLINQQ
ncbi:MAG: GIY-YIG nuclease family protein [Candidatus Omnitrophica bacterium]|nr:GIY-YIG nuclease family protein [Candidatus Omnitrophota bacterium]